jgi:hypothetical protein
MASPGYGTYPEKHGGRAVQEEENVFAPLALIVLLVACGFGEPKSSKDCERIGNAANRDECYAKVLPELFRTDPNQAESITDSQVSEKQIRDFIYLTVTRQIDPGSYRWCNKIEEPALNERCRVIVSRPHLHKELLGPTSGPPGRNDVSPPAPGGLPGSGAPGRDDANQPGPGGPPGSGLPSRPPP